jgi:ABC-2 type transport system permease protein
MTAASPAGNSPRPLPAVVLVARREILVRLRSRTFAAFTFVMVVLVVIGIVAASLLNGPAASASAPAVRVGFSGGSQALEQSFESTAALLSVDVSVSDISDEAAGRAKLTAGKLDMLVTGSATTPAAAVTDAVPAMAEIALDAAAQTARLNAAGLPPSAVTSVMNGVPFENVKLPEPSSPSESTTNVLAALGVCIVLYITLGAYGQFVAQGVVEEKATRMMEILLASVRPSELLAGKVLGIGFVAILQLAVVGSAALITVELTRGVSIPALGLGYVVAYLAWFVLGYLMYATALAAVAVLVSRPEEIAYATAPVTVGLVFSYLLMFVALGDPTNPFIVVLSMVPPCSPILMTLRIAYGVAPLWQVFVAMGLTIAAIVGLTWVAGRTYANSAMRFGARVRFLDALSGRRST